MTTRKDVQDAKMKTRAMAKTERKISLVEAKRNSRQRMVKSTDNVVRDIYGNVKNKIFKSRTLLINFSSILGSQRDEHDSR